MFGTSEPRCLLRRPGGLLWLPLWLLVATTSAHAQPSGLQLEVSADAQGCVSEASLRARLERFLRVHRPIDVEVVVRAGAEPVAFELRHDGVFAAERRFEVLPAGCSSRLDALALAIAVAVEHAVGPERASLEPGAVTGEPAEPAAATTETPAATPAAEPSDAAGEEAKPAPADEAAPAKPRSEPPQPAEPPEPPGPPLVVTVLAFLGGDLLIEALPDPALALHGGAELRLGSTFAVSLAGLYAPPIDVELGRAARAVSSLFGGRALGCAGSAPRGLRLEACAGAVGGVVWASGEGALERHADVSVGWAAGVLRAAASYPADGLLGVRLSLDGHINLVRPDLSLARPDLRMSADSPVPTTNRVSGVLGAAGSIEVWLALP